LSWYTQKRIKGEGHEFKETGKQDPFRELFQRGVEEQPLEKADG
jgi:hypothetical protein